jgi:hypothetical protein
VKVNGVPFFKPMNASIHLRDIWNAPKKTCIEAINHGYMPEREQ